MIEMIPDWIPLALVGIGLLALLGLAALVFDDLRGGRRRRADMRRRLFGGDAG